MANDTHARDTDHRPRDGSPARRPTAARRVGPRHRALPIRVIGTSTLAIALCLLGVEPAQAGPSVKKTTWVSWSETIRAVRAGWGLFATVAPAERRTPDCPAPLVPLLVGAQVTPAWVARSRREQTLPWDALGVWTVEFRGHYAGNDPTRAPVHFRTVSARGGETAEARFEGGMRWDDGQIFVSVSPTNGASPDVGLANFNVSLTATCGPDDVRLRAVGR